MNVYDIKNKANEILSHCDNLIKVLFTVGVISAIAGALGTLFGGTLGSLISLVVMIIMIPFSHGYIVSTLKCVNNRDDEIDVQQDSLVGFTRFKELFGTYFIYNALLVVIELAIVLVGFVMSLLTVPNGSFESLKELFNTIAASNGAYTLTTADMAVFNGMGYFATIILLVIIVVVVVGVIYELTFGLTPFILEKHHIKGIAAMKESKRLMKGYKLVYFKLIFSFIGWMILSLVITAVIQEVIGIIIGVAFISNLLSSIASVFVSVYLYEMRLKVCEAVLFEELDYADNQVK